MPPRRVSAQMIVVPTAVDRETKVSGPVRPGDRIEARTVHTTHAESIRKAP